MLLRPLRARSVDLAGVKALALLRIAQQIVGAGDFLELLFRRLVTGVEIRMQLLRKRAIGLLDVGGRSRWGNAENLVRISHDLPRGNSSSLRNQ